MKELKTDVEPDQTANPLRLGRETLRELDDIDLEQVAGGKNNGKHSRAYFPYSCRNAC